MSGSVTSDGREFKEVSQYVFRDAGFPVYLKSGIRDFKAKGRRDLGLKVWLHGTRDAQNNHRVYSATTLTVALGTRLSNHNVFENKRFLRFFFYKRTSNIHKFEGCFLRGQGRVVQSLVNITQKTKFEFTYESLKSKFG